MLRVIPFQQRTLGIGVHWTFLRLLGRYTFGGNLTYKIFIGFIPGGVLFGLMVGSFRAVIVIELIISD